MDTMRSRIMDALAGIITDSNRATRLDTHLVLVVDPLDTTWDVVYVQVEDTFESLVVCSMQFWSESVIMIYGSTKHERDKRPVSKGRYPGADRWHVTFTDHVGLTMMINEFRRRLADGLQQLVSQAEAG